jgi:hypothetical protein
MYYISYIVGNGVEENERGSSNVEYSVQQEPQLETSVLEDVLVELTEKEMMEHHSSSTELMDEDTQVDAAVVVELETLILKTMQEISLDFLLIKYAHLSEEMEEVTEQNLTLKVRSWLKSNPL